MSSCLPWDLGGSWAGTENVLSVVQNYFVSIMPHFLAFTAVLKYEEEGYVHNLFRYLGSSGSLFLS